MTTMLDDLKQAATPPVPKDFRPGIVYSGRNPSEITTDALPKMETEEEWEAAVKAMGIHLPEGYGLVLIEAVLAGTYNEAGWHRDPADRTEKRNGTAYTAPNTTQRWRYRFKVVLKDPRADADLGKMMREAAKFARQAVRPVSTGEDTSMVVALSDFQVGKVDLEGGTPELLERSEKALAEVLRQIKRQKPTQVVLVDVGDSTEGFESSPNAPRTNDLQMTEQIRVWRRIFWRWVVEISRVVEWLDVIAVGSNHCRVRAGKIQLGPASDDWGIEVLSQLADMAKVDEERFGHVVFHVPEEGLEYVVFDLMGGKLLGVVHGHQERNVKQLSEWCKKQGRRPIGLADVVLAGHFHHLRLESYGDGQTLFVAPTMDGGSAWFTNAAGERSRPGVLTFMVDSEGWRDMHVAWA